MYTMNAKIDNTKFSDMPNKEEATMVNLNQFNITQTELLFWLDNNTKVKHVLKEENNYHIFFTEEDEYKRLSEFLYKRIEKAA